MVVVLVSSSICVFSNQSYNCVGGRIAILCRFRHKFGGHYRAAPGRGRSHGTAGSVYREESSRAPQYDEVKYNPETGLNESRPSFLYVKFDAENLETPWYSLLIEGLSERFEFDEMELTNDANLELYHPTNLDKIVAVVHEFVGDRTGR